MTPDTAIHPWLAQFSEASQPLIVAWFSYAAHQQPPTPDALLTIVRRVVSNRLDWSTTPETRELCSTLLLAMCHRRREALDFASSLLGSK